MTNPIDFSKLSISQESKPKPSRGEKRKSEENEKVNEVGNLALQLSNTGIQTRSKKKKLDVQVKSNEKNEAEKVKEVSQPVLAPSSTELKNSKEKENSKAQDDFLDEKKKEKKSQPTIEIEKKEEPSTFQTSNAKLKEKADAWFKEGKFDEAFEAYTELSNRNREDGYALARRASIFLAKGKYDEAKKEIETIFQLKNIPLDALIWEVRACLSLLENKKELAIQDYFKALELDPENGFYWNELDELLSKEEKIKKLLPLAKQLYSRNSKNRHALSHYIKCSVSAENYSVAIEEFKRILSNDPTQNAIRECLINLLMNEKNYTEALSHLNIVISQNPKNYQAYAIRAKANRQLGHIEAAESDELESKREDQLALVFKGDQLRNTDRNDEALQIFDSLLKADPKHLLSRYVRIDIYLKLKRTDEALRDIEEAFRLDQPSNYIPWYLRGICYFLMKNFDKAFEDLDHALKLEPENERIWTEIAKVCIHQEKPVEEVLEYLKKPSRIFHYFDLAIKEFPKNPIFPFKRVLFYIQQKEFQVAFKEILNLKTLDDSQLNEILENFEVILKSEPTNAIAWQTRTNILFKQKKFAEALQFYNIALHRDPKNICLLLQRGQLNRRLNEIEAAKQDFQSVLALDADHIDARESWARCLLLQHQYEEAKGVLDVIFKRFPNYPSSLALQASINFQQGNHYVAIDELNLAVKIEPNNIRVREVQGDILRRLGQFREALNIFNILIQLDPEYALALASRAAINFDLNNQNIDSCQKDINLAFAIDPIPREPFIWLARAKMYRYLKEFDLAMADLKHLMELDPQNMTGVEIITDILFKKGKFQEALGYLNDLLNKSPNNASLLVIRAVFYHRVKQFEDAKNDFDRALKISNDPMVREALAQINFKDKQYASALQNLNIIMITEPKRFSALLLRAQVNLQMENLEEAFRDVDNILRLNPFHLDALSFRAKFFLQTGKYEDAFNDLKQVFEIDNNYLPALICRIESWRQMGNVDDALSETFRILKTNPDQAAVLALRGALFYEMGNLKQAKEMIEKSLQIDSEEPLAIEIKRDILWKEGHYNEALKDLNTFIEKNPQETSELSKRGFFYLRKGKLNEALNDFNEAFRRNSSRWLVRAGCGDVYRLMGNREEALKFLNEAYKHLPNNPFILVSKAATLHQKGKNKEAFEYVERVLKNDPYHANALALRGEMYLTEVKYDKALKDLAIACNKCPDEISVHLNYAFATYFKGSYVTALPLFEKILEAYPNNVPAMVKCGDIYRRIGNLDEAEKYLRKVLVIDPNHSSALAYLGDVIKHKDIEQAIVYFQKAISSNPGEYFALMNYGMILLEKHQLDQAHECFDAVLTKVCHDPIAWKYKIRILYRQGKLIDCLHVITTKLHFEDSNIENLWKRGEILIILGRIDEALLEFIKILKLDSKHIDTIISLNFSLNYQNLTDKDLFTILNDINPVHPVTIACDGLKFSSDQSALKYLDQAIKNDPFNLDILAHKAIRLFKLSGIYSNIKQRGDVLKEALKLFKTLLQINPENFILLYGYGHLITRLQMLAIEDPSSDYGLIVGQELIEMAQDVNNFPNEVGYLIKQGIVEYFLGNFTNSFKDLDKAIHLKSELPLAFFWRSFINCIENKYDLKNLENRIIADKRIELNRVHAKTNPIQREMDIGEDLDKYKNSKEHSKELLKSILNTICEYNILNEINSKTNTQNENHPIHIIKDIMLNKKMLSNKKTIEKFISEIILFNAHYFIPLKNNEFIHQ